MPKQQKKPCSIGFAQNPPQFVVKPLSLTAIQKILKKCEELFVTEPEPGFKYGEGLYDAGQGKLFLLQRLQFGWNILIRRVSDAEAFAWFAEHDQGECMLSGDESTRTAFLNRISMSLTHGFRAQN